MGKSCNLNKGALKKSTFKLSSLALLITAIFPIKSYAFLYDLKIGGIDKEPRGILNFEVKDDKHYIACKELRRLKVPSIPEDCEKIALEDLGTVTVNDLENYIELKFPTDKMPTSIVDLGRGNYYVDYSKTKFSDGLFLNYDISAGSEIRGGAGSIFSIGANVLGWEVRSLFSYQIGEKFERLNSNLQRELKDGKIITVGDLYSETGGVISPRILTGIQLKSDKDTDEQGYLLSPTVRLNGTAEASSTVEVLINGASILKSQINEGPFSVRNISPSISGTDVKIIVRDALGREQVLEQSLYGDSQMLAKGKYKYALTSGKVRFDASSYGPISTSGYYAYGLADNINIRVAGDLFDGQKKIGAQVDYVSDIGRIKTTFQKSDDNASAGVNYGKSFKLPRGILSVAAGLNYDLSKLRLENTDVENITTETREKSVHSISQSISLGYSINNINSSFFYAKQANGYLTSIGTSLKLDRFGFKDWAFSLNAGAGETNKGEKYKSMNMFLSIPLDTSWGKGSLSLRSGSKNGQLTNNATAIINRPRSWSYGVSVNNSSSSTSASMYTSKSFDKFNAKAQLGLSKERRSYEVGLSGGVILSDSGVAFAQKIPGSWAVVDASEKDVSILISKVASGVSNDKGILIASMPTKRNIDIELDERTAPIEIEAKSMNVAAPYGKGAKVEFVKIKGQFIKLDEGFKGDFVEINDIRYPVTKKGAWVELAPGKYKVTAGDKTFEVEIPK